jgi:hypothetical protein
LEYLNDFTTTTTHNNKNNKKKYLFQNFDSNSIKSNQSNGKDDLDQDFDCFYAGHVNDEWKKTNAYINLCNEGFIVSI